MRLALSVALTLSGTAAFAQCGGSFSGFLSGVKQEAVAQGYSANTVDRFLSGAAQDPAVLRADRSQGIFQLPFVDFARRVISANRIQNGQKNAQRYAAVFDRIERDYGVSRGVLLAFWALETDYGAVQGNFNTRNALLTLAHDCRRPDLFRPQVFAALELYSKGQFDLNTTGAWAGEIGQVQMLPADIIENGVDGDGDGRVDLKGSSTDALMSGGKMLRHLGWRAGEPWMQEVTVPADMDWSLTGLDTERPTRQWAGMGVTPRVGSLPNLDASLILPQGRKGPAFLVYPNFRVFFEWNQSFVYVTTASYFATRLEGAPVFNAGSPETGLNEEQLKDLQRKLAARGHDVGAIDGILGARTRRAVQAEQARFGLPADAWPTPALLQRL
ncbi:MAG: lytic murein transglycosylase [Pseudomonadota bacterium]